MMKVKVIVPIVLLTAYLLLSGCSREQLDDCYTNTGPETKVERSVGAFHSIELYNNVNLVLTQGSDFQLTVEGGNNILSAIKTDVSDSTLIIHNTMKCNWMRTYHREITVYATLPNLRDLRYESSGDVKNTGQFFLDSLNINIRGGAGTFDLNLNVNKLILSMHYGTTDVHVKGESRITVIAAESYGPFYCNELKSNIVYINNRGSNDCYIHAIHELEAKLFSLGNIYYTGDPYHIDCAIEGSGKLIKVD